MLRHVLQTCSADAALRRSIPAFNKDVREVQGKLEDVAFKLRIPQRKPWPAMVDDVRAASNIVSQPDRVSIHSWHAYAASAMRLITASSEIADLCPVRQCLNRPSLLIWLQGTPIAGVACVPPLQEHVPEIPLLAGAGVVWRAHGEGGRSTGTDRRHQQGVARGYGSHRCQVSCHCGLLIQCSSPPTVRQLTSTQHRVCVCEEASLLSGGDQDGCVQGC